MKPHPFKRSFLLFLAGSAAFAEDPAAVCRSFQVKGVECGGCVYVVEQSLRERKGVASVQVIQGLETFARVTFNPLLVGEQCLAQAVREATPLHGEPYAARLRMRIRGYAQNSALVRDLFERWKDSVRFEELDAEKGELLLSFLPLKGGGDSPNSVGWSLSVWRDAAKQCLPAELTWEIPLD